MYKVMIVDDEQLTRSFLKTMIPKLTPDWLVITEASDGAQACSLLASGHHDLVITDIKMPIMDGVALCETIHRDFPHIITVILSGYGEFEYAKKAIQYGVSNYLLKPIVNSELQAMLNEIAIVLNQNEASNLEYLKLVELSSRYKEDIGTNLLQAIVSQAHVQIRSLFPLLYQLDISLMDEESVILVIQQSYTIPTSKTTSTNIALTKLLIYQTALKALKGTTTKVFLDTLGNTLVYLPLSQNDNLRETVYQVHNTINVIFDQTMSVELNTYVGSVETDILQLSLSYENANKSILQSMFETEKTPVNFYVETLYDSLMEQLYHQLSTLAYALSSHDTVTTKLTTDNLLEYELNHLSPWATTQFCFYALDYLCDYLSIDYVTMSNIIDLSSGIELIEDTLNKPLLDSQAENELVSKVKSYILNHYYEPISLSLIADILTVSPSYLSNLFHESVGQSYIKYLTDVRMKQAAMLLRNHTSMTLEEITKKVGYISVKHFSYVFKKHFIMTTSEYKNSFTIHQK